MSWIECNKLVRDGVLDFIKKTGGQEKSHLASPTELCGACAEKLIEEARESAEAIKLHLISGEPNACEKVAEELGDLREIILKCQALCGITDNQVEAARLSKMAKRGGFARGVILERYALGPNQES